MPDKKRNKLAAQQAANKMFGRGVGKKAKGPAAKPGAAKPGLRPAGRVKKSKPVNTPGERQRAFKGRIDHMISKAEGEFKKMIKGFRAKLDRS